MMLPPSFIDALRSRVVISAVVARHVPLKKAGRELTGLCPFHQEKSPSFTVSDAKGFYHCFGCGAHGDAIGFVQRVERISFREAVEKLAREAGMRLPDPDPEVIRREAQAAPLKDALEAACRWFERNLGAPEQARVRDYVRERGISDETRTRFRLGFAPDARDGLKRHLLSEGVTEAQAVEAGLLGRADDGATYDRFRGRLIFPIRDARGRVVAFGGRLLAPNSNAPKYLNSPETPLFKKGEMLFNSDQAAPAARERGEMIVAEGYMDVVMLAQYGFAHSVATLGTSVTEAHLRLLWHYAPEPMLCLDGDAAGARAMLRAAELALPLLKPGYSLRFAALPPKDDPDSLLRARGAEAMSACLNAARPLSQALWESASRDAPDTAEGRAALEHALNAYAARVQDATVKSHLRDYFRSMLWQRRGKPVAAPSALSAPRSKSLAAFAVALACACPEAVGAEEEALLSRLEGASMQEEEARQAVLLALLGEGEMPPPARALEVDAAKEEWRALLRAEHREALKAEHDALMRSGEVSDAAHARLCALQEELRRTKAEA